MGIIGDDLVSTSLIPPWSSIASVALRQSSKTGQPAANDDEDYSHNDCNALLGAEEGKSLRDL